jgi:hypothetical protein
LDVITKNLAVTLGSTLSKTLSTFSAWRERVSQMLMMMMMLLL